MSKPLNYENEIARVQMQTQTLRGLLLLALLGIGCMLLPLAREVAAELVEFAAPKVCR